MIKYKRNSNIELLRIICMFLIVMHHYSVHGGVKDATPFNQYLLDIMVIGARMAINCFILITGFFCISSQKSIKNKVIRLWIHRVFYSIVISIVFVIIGQQTISIKYTLSALLPIIMCRHNFVTSFFMVYLSIPFLNKLLNALSKKEFQLFLIYYTMIISLLPTILTPMKIFTSNTYSYLAWMVFIYCIGAYIKLYGLPLHKSRPFYMWLAAGGMLFLIVMTLWIEPKVSFLPKFYTSNTQHSFFVLLISICVFSCFLKSNVDNFVINYISDSTFTVLLIHDDPLVRGVIWSKIFNCPQYGLSSYLWLHAFITVFCIYFFCVFVDKIIKRLFLQRLWRSFL